uniref:Serine-threonine/tyrosine-protein kinase catalytic domain-containing protein n=1 Tax=Oryza glumipatula TaxID=40148 RepID=A0A0E0B7S8_9ORYZ
MEDKLGLPENKLRDFIQGADKAKWIAKNNHNIKYFTEDDIKRTTSNYSTSLGMVHSEKYSRIDSEEEFAKEVIVHSQVNHKNVVRLIGCCTEKNAPIMVFEYVSNGTLCENPHGSNVPVYLDKRLGIAIQCAEALEIVLHILPT